MKNEEKNDGINIGKYLMGVREAAGLTQAELAKKITVSPAQISRVESGSLALTDEEMDKLLDAIGENHTRSLREYLAQNWDQLDRPPYDHPSLNALWEINGMIGSLRKLKADPELKSVFVRHIETYERELQSLADDLRRTDHAIAFVGSIGVGKSTAICTVSGLRFGNEGPFHKQMVLEAGAGGTTICEVHIKSGPQFGLIVEPRSEESIRQDVADFAEFLLRTGIASQLPVDAGDSEGPGISKEINRAIRNMSNLDDPKTKDPVTGRSIRHDQARDLAKRYSDPKELAVQILSLMNLPRRDRRDIWYSSDSKLPPLEWLQETFIQINNGRHPHFSLPQRIEVVIPRPLLEDKNLDIHIVDTKGIDGAATRADLDRLFDDPRTFIVLCSRFNDAPENSLQQLLQRVKDAGVRGIAEKTMILVLPRPDESLAVKDNSGMTVEDEQEGYDLKRGDVEMQLSRLCLQTLPIEFFNARNGKSNPVRTILAGTVRGIRAKWELRVKALSKTVEDLLVNHNKEQTAVIFREVMNRLNIWLTKNRDVGGIADQAQQELLKAIQQAHPRSVWASVRRKGEWYNLDYYYQLGYGARTIAAKYILKKVTEFEVIIQNLLDDPSLEPAHAMLEQVKQVLRLQTDELLKKMEIFGKAAFEDTLRQDNEFWITLQAESGRGYRDSVMSNSNEWFKVDIRAEKHAFIKTKILESWTEILSELDKLLEQAGGA